MARKNLLKGFKRPKGITFEHSELDTNTGRFIAYPFERGRARQSETPCADYFALRTGMRFPL
jgi:hypothetical protein